MRSSSKSVVIDAGQQRVGKQRPNVGFRQKLTLNLRHGSDGYVPRRGVPLPAATDQIATFTCGGANV
jgi:hypothetical protein